MNRLEMNIDEIYFAALEIEDENARSDYLDSVCDGDLGLRDKLEGLLEAAPLVGGFLESPAGATLATTELFGDEVENAATAIGPYTLLEQIGEGGMGVVYLAEQTAPVRRRAALKLIKPGMDTRQVVARFEAERQALAMMEHPNIARVFDAGATESGRPYFVMELVHGVPITEYCDAHRLSIDDRLDLFVRVCQAVQHAHQKGIIHRDIKPSNVLITVLDGEAVPKVIDFGVAKAAGPLNLTDKTLFTGIAQIVGTPLYMSPEQAELTGTDVDTRSDVYSLGVLLYELLTGTTPFDSGILKRASFDEVRRIIRDQEPPKPSTRLNMLGATLTEAAARRSSAPRQLNRLVRGELDWIVMKALEKDRRRRYVTANEFAADVMRYLADQPVLASPHSTAYRFRKFARRHRTSLMTAVLVGMSLLVGTALSLWQAMRATHAEARADRHRDRAEKNAEEAVRQRDEAQGQKRAVLAREASLRRYLYAADIKLAWQAWNDAWCNDDMIQMRRLLNRHKAEANREDLRTFAWYYLKGLCGQEPRATLKGHEGKVYHLAVSPDGKFLASASQDATVRLWDLATSRLAHTLRGHSDEVNCVVFAPDGKELATVSDDRTARFWDPFSGRERSSRALTGFNMPVHRVDYSADGKLLVTGEFLESERKMATTLWEVSSRKPRVRLEGHYPLTLSPDSKTLATTSLDFDVRLRDVTDGRELSLLHGHDAVVLTGAFSPDGRNVATGSHDGSVRLWKSSRQQAGLWRWPNSVHSVSYSPDGRLVAAGYESGAIFLWRADDGRLDAFFGGHALRARAVRFTPDGRTLASVGDDRTVKLWNLTTTSRARQPNSQPEPFTALSFSHDGELLATSIGAKHSMLWTVRTGKIMAVTRDHADREVKGVAFSPAGPILAATSLDQSISLIDPITKDRRLTIARSGVTNGLIAFSPDGRLLVGEGNDETVRVWDANSGKELHALAQVKRIPNPRSIAISPDGKTLALQTDGRITCWNLDTGVTRDIWKPEMGSVSCLSYSPDGRTLAIGAANWGGIRLLDARTGLERAILSGGRGAMHSVAFSPDGRTLASGGHGGEVRLWDVATAQELISLAGHTGAVQFTAFSPDGNTLATAGESADGRRGELRFWRAEIGEFSGGKAKHGSQ